MPFHPGDPVIKHYRRLEVIGRGKFGTVYKGLDLVSKKLVAIKVLNLDTEQDEVREVQNEIQFLSQLKSIPNVTHYYGSYLNGHNLWIIMDYCAGGSVRTLLRPGPLEERYISVIAREMLLALQFVHENGVIHRDIKSANVLISKEGRVQLCDFGVAAQLTSRVLRRTTMAGTPYWMAPEVITEGSTYNVKADIWSFGITIYEMATGNPPYGEQDAVRALQMITHHEPPRLEGRQYSSQLKEFVAMCLEEKPELRPSAADLLHSRFIRSYRQVSTSALKEVIGRYLLWRDRREQQEKRKLEREARKKKSSPQVSRPNSSQIDRKVNERLNQKLKVDEMNQKLQSGNGSNNTTNTTPTAVSDGTSSGDSGASSAVANHSGRSRPSSGAYAVKWDFDSLKSAEYIIENDIDVDAVSEESMDDERDEDGMMGSGYGSNMGTAWNPETPPFQDLLRGRSSSGDHSTASPTTVTPFSAFTEHTMMAGGETGGQKSTARTQPAVVTPEPPANHSKVPQSLMKLFKEGESDSESENSAAAALDDALSNPDLLMIPEVGITANSSPDAPIEIPSMDALELQEHTQLSEPEHQAVQEPQQGQQTLQMPAPSQQPSRSMLASPRSPGIIRSRATTITSSQPSKLQLAAANGCIPPHRSNSDAELCSPTGSPRRMKPLTTSNSQPLLQPINTAQVAAMGPPDKLNQFGVNITLASNKPLVMTPVSEKPERGVGFPPPAKTEKPTSLKSASIEHTLDPLSQQPPHPNIKLRQNSAPVLEQAVSARSALPRKYSISKSLGSALDVQDSWDDKVTDDQSQQTPLQAQQLESQHSPDENPLQPGFMGSQAAAQPSPVSATMVMARLAELHVVDTFDSLTPSSILGEPVQSDVDFSTQRDSAASNQPAYPPLEDTDEMATEVSAMFSKFKNALGVVIEQMS